MENVRKTIEKMTPYIGRQFLFGGDVYTIEDCRVLINSKREVVTSRFVCYTYKNSRRKYTYDFIPSTIYRNAID